MDFIQGRPRSQLVLIESSLEERIEQDKPFRIIDAFVDNCKLEEFGFTHVRHAKEGKPPDHNTIVNFRKDNPKAIKLVFRKMVSICKNLDLIGCKVIATDGTKLRAQNSKKNNYNQKKINDHLKFIETRLSDYLDALDIADTAESLGLDPDINKEKIREKIARLNERKNQYKKLEQQLGESGQQQISTTDPESRKLPIRQKILEVFSIFRPQSCPVLPNPSVPSRQKAG